MLYPKTNSNQMWLLIACNIPKEAQQHPQHVQTGIVFLQRNRVNKNGAEIVSLQGNRVLMLILTTADHLPSYYHC
jgi:hypothetical protein